MLMKFLKRHHPCVPIILFSETDHDEEQVKATLLLGAHPYRCKGSMKELIKAVRTSFKQIQSPGLCGSQTPGPRSGSTTKVRYTIVIEQHDPGLVTVIIGIACGELSFLAIADEGYCGRSPFISNAVSSVHLAAGQVVGQLSMHNRCLAVRGIASSPVRFSFPIASLYNVNVPSRKRVCKGANPATHNHTAAPPNAMYAE